MNERMKQLAEQATTKEEFYPAGCNGYPEYRYYFNKEKFAELIVRECAALAMTQHFSTSPADYDEMEPYYQGCDDTASAISGLIRRTFGVEE